MFSTGSSISARLTALASRNFRVFFCGQSVSLIGTWMQQVAVSWMVYRLTHSAWWLGAVAFASQCPSFFLAPFAGVIADRWNRRTVLLVTQSLALIQAVALAVLTSGGLLNVPLLLTLGFFLGCVNATDLPTRQSFFADLVEDKAALGNAVALNSMMVHAARLIGPALAGWLIWRAGEQICFLLNALTYVASIIALLAISPALKKGISQTGGLVERLKDG